jgi:hypothetical protein
LPALQSGVLTFGSFNRINKINAETIALWSELLHALPATTLVIGGLDHESHQSLIDRFAAHDIARTRLTLFPRCDMEGYLALYHRVDLCLDDGCSDLDHCRRDSGGTAGRSSDGERGAGWLRGRGLCRFRQKGDVLGQAHRRIG